MSGMKTDSRSNEYFTDERDRRVVGFAAQSIFSTCEA